MCGVIAIYMVPGTVLCWRHWLVGSIRKKKVSPCGFYLLQMSSILCEHSCTTSWQNLSLLAWFPALKRGIKYITWALLCQLLIICIFSNLIVLHVPCLLTWSYCVLLTSSYDRRGKFWSLVQRFFFFALYIQLQFRESSCVYFQFLLM